VGTTTRYLDPLERSLEVLFGLTMLLVVTASIDVANAGAENVQDVLLGAIGCNVAWGAIDAIMYLIATFSDRARQLATIRAIRASREPGAGQLLVAEVLPQGLARMLGEKELEMMRRRLTTTRGSLRASLGRDDYMGAAGVFLLVFLSTLPVILPFVFMREVGPALRVSQGIGAVMLFAIGWSLGVHAGRPGWRTGFAMVGVGAVLSGMTFALGG
jgi:VIT1/CCC1 family predicted Fe2+/Mn2+ transporter